MGRFVTPDGAEYKLPGIDDPGAAMAALKTHPALGGKIPEGTRFFAGDAGPAMPPAPDAEDTLDPSVTGPPIEGIATGGGDTRGVGKFIVQSAPAPLYAIPYAGPVVGGLASSALGQAYDRLASDKPFSLGDFAKDAAIDAGIGYAGKGLYYGGRGLYRAATGPGSLAEDLYQGALKPSTALKGEQVKERVRTGLKEGIRVNEAGLEKLRGTVDSINKEISGLITGATEQGGKVSKSAIVDSLLKMRDAKMADNLVGYKEYKDAIDSVVKEVAEHPSGEMMSLAEAQKFKQNIYKAIRTSYENAKKLGKTTMDPATVQGYRQVASTLRDEIEKAIPEIKMLNARERNLLNLQDSLERAVGRVNNWDLIGLSEPLIGVVLGGGTPAGRVTAMVGAKILKSPTVRSRIAIALAKNRIPLSDATKAILRPPPGGGAGVPPAARSGGGGIAEEAKRLGIEYRGNYPGTDVYQFQDPLTGGGFATRAGESIENKLLELRASLSDTPPPSGFGGLTGLMSR